MSCQRISLRCSCPRHFGTTRGHMVPTASGLSSPDAEETLATISLTYSNNISAVEHRAFRPDLKQARLKVNHLSQGQLETDLPNAKRSFHLQETTARFFRSAAHPSNQGLIKTARLLA